MHRVDTLRLIAFSTIALLLYSAGATAGCIMPERPDPIPLKHSPPEARYGVQRAFQSGVYEFIACQRSSLQKRARGLAPSEVRQLILRDRAAEDRAIAELESLNQCFSYSRRESDPEIARRECERIIESTFRDRSQPEWLRPTDLMSDQRSAYGGVWSYRTLDLGRPGDCMDAPCDNMFGVEVTNMTPVVLMCEVVLKASNGREGTLRGEQVITLNPGDSLPAARVTIQSSVENVEPEVMCAPAAPLAPAPRVPAACVVNWEPRSFDFPMGLVRPSWESGTALLEFTAPERYGPPEAIRIVHADSSRIAQGAQAMIQKLRFFTNCASERFRLRAEYRAFPCYVCFPRGVVTLYRDS